MSKKIMILGASILQLPAIRKAKEMGLYVIAVDMNSEAIGLQYADESLVISTNNIPEVVKAAKQRNIDGVMTLATDMPMLTVAKVAEECSLVGIDSQTAVNATNKAVMCRCLKDSGVPVPEFYKASDREEYNRAVKIFSEKDMKFIVKPSDNSGSRGIYLVDEPRNEEMAEKAYHHSKEFSRSGDIVVEEYMEGPEVSVETLSYDGKCYIVQITDKLTSGAPFFVEMGHSQPTRLAKSVEADIRCVAEMAVKAVGIKYGPSHTEIKATKNGAKIVELGARLGGDFITTHLVPLSTGVDMVEDSIRIAMGEKPDIHPRFSKGSAIRYFKTDNGIIRKIEGIEEAEKINGVGYVRIVHGVGERVCGIESSGDRVGFVISSAENAETAVKICENALSKVKFTVD